LLAALEKVKGNIQLTIVATLEDLAYWEKCRVKMQELQDRIKVNLMIDLPHHQIKQHIEQAHFFVLPTEGENFGHAIFEALAVGCPIIISDQTPWRNLASKRAGFDLSLQDINSFSNAIQSCVDMDNEEWQEFREGAWEVAKGYSVEMNPELSYFQLFNT
jgi:glycosyltransferase involved in cell wall biosynthesis